MTKKAPCRMGLGFVLASAVFLFNPIIGFKDILPDFFGYLLLYVGLSRLADLNPHILEARKKLRALLWVGGGQILAMWIIYDLLATSKNTNYDRSTWILVFSFSLAFFKWYFLLPTLRQLFLGMERMVEKYQSEKLNHPNRRFSESARMRQLSVIFVVLSTLGSTLPELTVLTAQSMQFSFDWYEFIFMFRVVGCGFAAIVGLGWLLGFVRYFGRALLDRAWLERIYRDYASEILTQKGLLTVRRFRGFTLLLQIAIVFSVTLRINYFAVLPSVGLAAFAILAIFWSEKRFSEKRTSICVAGIGLAVVSIAHFVANSMYLHRFLPKDSLNEPDAFVRYLVVRLLGVAEAGLTMLLIWLLLQMLLEIVYEHTSVEYEGDVTHTLSNAATARLHGEFEKRTTWIFVLFFLGMLGNMVDAFFMLQLPWMWLVSFVLSFFGIAAFYSLLHELQLQIQARYFPDPAYKKE